MCLGVSISSKDAAPPKTMPPHYYKMYTKVYSINSVFLGSIIILKILKLPSTKVIPT